MESRGTYRLLEVLKPGQHTLVAKAVPSVSDSDAACVLLKSLAADASAHWKESMNLLSGTRSPHLRVPLRFESDDQGEFLVTRWLPGPSLEEARVQRYGGKIPVRQALLWLRHLLLGLEILHHHGLLHGDIKPSNLLLDEQDRAVLVDLGAVQPIGQNEVMAATDEYLIPNPSDQGSVKRDLFAAAFTFGALLTGTLPKGTESSPWLPSRADPLLPRAVDRILIGVQSSPGFQSVIEMKEAVDDLLGTDEGAVPETVGTSPPTRRVTVPKRSKQVNLVLWLMVILCFPLGFGAAAVWKAPPEGPTYTLPEITGIDVREGVYEGEPIWQTTILGRPVAAFSGPDQAAGGESAELRARWLAAVLQELLLKEGPLDFEFRRELPQFSEVWLKRADGNILVMRVTQHEKKTFSTDSPELARRWVQTIKDTLALLGQKKAPGRSEGMLLLRPWKSRAETLSPGTNLHRTERVRTLVEAFHSLKPDLQEEILSTYLPAQEEHEKEQ